MKRFRLKKKNCDSDNNRVPAVLIVKEKILKYSDYKHSVIYFLLPRAKRMHKSVVNKEIKRMEDSEGR